MVSVFCVLVIVVTAFAAVGRDVKAEIETQTEYTEEEIENQFLKLLNTAGYSMDVSVQEDVDGNYKISFESDNPGYYECTLAPAHVDAFMRASNNINPMLGKEQQNVNEYERNFLNPFVATDGNIHMVWQEKADDNFEIFYTNDEGKQYENMLMQVIEGLGALDDKNSQKAIGNLNEALNDCLEQDFKHSIDNVHHAVKNFEKTENTETINTLVDSVRDFAKTNILYAEYDLTFNNTYIQKAYEKYYLAVDKYEKGNYDSAIEQFKNSYLKIVEAYEEKGEIFIGVDFGETVRISYTDYDSVAPEIFLNGLISVGWVEVLPEENHVYYARTHNGINWWYFDATEQKSLYLESWGIGSIIGAVIQIIITIIIYLILLLLTLIILALEKIVGGLIPGPTPPPPPPPDPEPDLCILDVTFSPQYPVAATGGYNSVTTISAWIDNEGAYVNQIDVTFWDNGVEIGTVTSDLYPLLLPQGKEVSIDYNIPTTGSHTIKAVVDPHGAIDDGDTSNNERSEAVSVLDPAGNEDGDTLINYDEVYGFTSGYVVNPTGFIYKTNPYDSDTDKDGCNDDNDPIPLDYNMDGDGMINYVSMVEAGTSYYVARLVTPVNNDENLQRYDERMGILIPDDDIDGDGISNNEDSDDDNDGMPDDYEKDHGVAYGGWQNPKMYNARYAVIVGGGDTASDKNWPAFTKDSILTYDGLKAYGYTDDNIYCYIWDKSAGSEGGKVDGQATLDNIVNAYLDIGNKLTANDLFYFTEISHGVKDESGNKLEQFIIYSPYNGGQNSVYSFSQLNTDVTNNVGTHYARAVFVCASCFSGWATEKITLPNCIIITSAKKDEFGMAWKYGVGGDVYDHAEFMYNNDAAAPGFVRDFGSITDERSLDDLYWRGYAGAQDDTDIFGLPDISTPQLKENNCLASDTYI